MKKTLFVNAFIIIVTSLLFNTIGISFRVFLSNEIGTEGMGLFQLILSIYMMATLFVVTGMNLAVTRLVAEEGGRRSFSVSRALLIRASSVSLLFSIPAFLFLFLGADYIGTKWLQDTRTIISLKLLAVSMPFIGISSCIKGYFYAMSKMIRPTSTQAFEIMVQIFVTVEILDHFMIGGLEYACAAIVLGITISELASCMYILTLYWFEQRKNDQRISEIFYQKRIFKKLIAISLPVSVSSLVRAGLKTMENIMIPIGFEKYGYTKKLSLEEYGRIQGMVFPILLFPSSILNAFSSLLIPEVSEANALNHKKRVNYAVTRVLQLTFLMSILVSCLFILFSRWLGLTIYGSIECGVLMKILAPLIPLMYLDTVVDGLLKGLNQQVSSLKYNLIDAAMRIILIYYLVPAEGVYGFIFVLYASNILNTTLSICRLLTVTQIRLKKADWILKPILSASASGFLIWLAFDTFGHDYFPDVINIAVGSAAVSLLYIIFLIMMNCITKDDINWFKNMFKYSKGSSFEMEIKQTLLRPSDFKNQDSQI